MPNHISRILVANLGILLMNAGRLANAEPTTLPATPDLGANASLHGKLYFPADHPWNQDVSNSPIDPNSDHLIAGIGLTKPLHPDFGAPLDGQPNGIPYVIVDGNQPKVPIHFTAYGDESDPGPYPVPAGAPIEGGPKGEGDRHVLVVDRDRGWLYELDRAFSTDAGWKADSGAIFDLNKPKDRPAGWTSADAAGLPIFPGLVRYDEVMEQKAIHHALRFTVKKSRHAYIPPARHFASPKNDPNLPPMGMRVRLKASVDISKYPPECQVIFTALKKHGMIVADNGGAWFLSGVPDPRWNDDALHQLGKIHGSDFEVIRMEGIVVR